MRKLSATKLVAIDTNNIVHYGQSSFLDVVTNVTFATTVPVTANCKKNVCAAYLAKRRIEKSFEELKLEEDDLFDMLYEIDAMWNKQLIDNEEQIKNMKSAKEIRNFLNCSE